MDILTTPISFKFEGIMPDGDVKKLHNREHFEIVSRVAYLIGVNRKYFTSEGEGLSIQIFNQLELQKKARIIRNLCILRTQIEHNFLKVCKAIQQEGRSMIGMPEMLPSEAFDQLDKDGINIYTHLKEPSPFLYMLNQNIKDRINNCKDIFPVWLSWEYLSDIFIMPDGMTDQGTKRAAKTFYENINCYPYKAYINWIPEEEGNILYNDRVFVTLLYKQHCDEFRELNFVSDVSDYTKQNIYSFIEKSNKCVFVVDCENSDPYDLCAAIRNLDPEKLEKIEKVILFDDIHAASAWQLLQSYIEIPVEYIMIERLKDNKSLADIKVAARTCREYYENQVDSFVLVSSDSDYWGLLEELPEANFLIMVEHTKCSGALKEKLVSNGIFYCYIDSFYVEGGKEIRDAALNIELKRTFENELDLNLNEIMNEVLNRTRIRMSDSEKREYIKKNIKRKLTLDITDTGNVSLKYKN